MTYSDFDLNTARRTFGLTITQEPLFPAIEPLPLSPWLQEALNKGEQLALVSEKARSEFIVAPILLSSRDLSHNRVQIYSGQRLDVEPQRGLSGECDFILSWTPPSPTLQAPVVVIVEAKKNDIESGLGQCTAQMIGASLFNQQEGNGLETIFGCVTTGETWQFLKLETPHLLIDSHRYYINEVEQILGVFQAILNFYKTKLVVV